MSSPLNSDHPLWRVGFRPFFVFACLSGALLPALWLLLRAGLWTPPALAVPAHVWHAHEMFYGFGWAMLGGFLLTASKNWVGIRGYHGGTLMLLAAAWLLDRIVMLYAAVWSPPLVTVASLLFPALAVGLLLHTLIVHRSSDSYRDNLYFILALPLFLPAKWLLLAPEHFIAGRDMSLALFRLAFLIMLERTLTQFMKTAFQVSLPRHPVLDHGIKTLACVLIASPWLPASVNTAVSLVLAMLLIGRWMRWHGLRALSRLDIGIMYLGYLALAIQLALDALTPWTPFDGMESAVLHLFALGTLGAITPAMIVRIAKGHTGRKVHFDTLDRRVLGLMLAAVSTRVLLPPWMPEHYENLLWISAALWLTAFATLGYRYIPWLFMERADGRIH